MNMEAIRLWQAALVSQLVRARAFEGIMLSQTGFKLQTKISMTGRPLAQSVVALNSNVLTAQ